MQPTSSVLVFILIALKCAVYGEIVAEGSGLLTSGNNLEYNDRGMEYDESSSTSTSTSSEPASPVADQRKSILKSGTGTEQTRKSVRIEEPKAERELGFPDEFDYDDDYFVQVAAQQNARKSAGAQDEASSARRSTPQFLKAVQQQRQSQQVNQPSQQQSMSVQQPSQQPIQPSQQQRQSAPGSAGPLQLRQAEGLSGQFDIPELKHYTAPQVHDRSPMSGQNKMMRSRQSFLQIEQGEALSSAMQNRKSMMQNPSRQSTFQASAQSRQSTFQPSRQSTFQSSRKSSFQPSTASSGPVSDLSGVQLGFCDTAALALVVNIRLLGIKFPRQSTSSERGKMSLYISNMVSNFPCDMERGLMNEAMKAMPAMYSDRPSFTRWAEIFSKRVLRGINSPVAINLGNVLVPTKVYKNNRKTIKK